MGKFLRDSEGNMVAIEGGLVLERSLDRKPRDCESCGFSKWAKGDKCFIIQGGSGNKNNNIVGGGSMQWICPDCAILKGLPIEFYHKNFFSEGNDLVRELLPHATTRQQQQQQAQEEQTSKSQGPIEKLLDITTSLCSF